MALTNHSVSRMNSSYQTVEDLIVDRIYRAVMEQRLAPNTKLGEASLCKAFGVGRMHVRRALLLLSSHGIIDLRSNRGAYIACPDNQQANEVFEARMLIEPPLIRHLAEKAGQKQLKLLLDHIELERAAHANNDRIEVIRLSGEFHAKAAEATGNKLMTKIVRELVTRTSLIVGLFGSSKNSNCPDDEHDRILEAISLNDPDKSEYLIKRHLKHIRENLDMDSKKQPDDNLTKILGLG